MSTLTMRRHFETKTVVHGGGRSRKCASCGRTYSRRNLEERWYCDVAVNGKPASWLKKVERICLHCSIMEGVKNAKLDLATPAWAIKGKTD